MIGPLDAITAIHNAARAAMASFDKAALAAARDQSAQKDAFKPLHLFNEIISWHAEGEEHSLFPLTDPFAPSMAEDYTRDHHEITNAGSSLEAAIGAGDMLEAARTAAALKLQLQVHLAKEDTHLYPMLKQRKTESELYQAVGQSFAPIPKKRLPEVVNIAFMLMGNDDRERLTRVWQRVMPASDFATVRDLIRSAVGNDWAELTRRMPELEQRPGVRPSREERREATSGPGGV